MSDFSLKKYENVMEMLDYVRTFDNYEITGEQANAIIDEIKHLVRELGTAQVELNQLKSRSCAGCEHGYRVAGRNMCACCKEVNYCSNWQEALEA